MVLTILVTVTKIGPFATSTLERNCFSNWYGNSAWFVIRSVKPSFAHDSNVSMTLLFSAKIKRGFGRGVCGGVIVDTDIQSCLNSRLIKRYPLPLYKERDKG